LSRRVIVLLRASHVWKSPEKVLTAKQRWQVLLFASCDGGKVLVSYKDRG
jgi:hypothetical protein